MISYNNNSKDSNGENEHLNSSMMIPLVQSALKRYKRSRPKRGISTTFPANLWYDKECKAAKRALKGRKERKENIKECKQLIKS